MGVGADHQRGAAVAEVAQRHLLAGRLGMDVDDDGVGRPPSGWRESSRSSGGERIVQASMNSRPITFTTSTLRPWPSADGAARPGVPGGIVERPDQARIRSMWPITSRWSQTWLPMVRTSVPAA